QVRSEQPVGVPVVEVLQQSVHTSQRDPAHSVAVQQVNDLTGVLAEGAEVLVQNVDACDAAAPVGPQDAVDGLQRNCPCLAVEARRLAEVASPRTAAGGEQDADQEHLRQQAGAD